MPLNRFFFFNGALTEDEMCGVGVMHSSTWPTPGRGQALIYSILTHSSAKGQLGYQKHTQIHPERV